MAGRRDEVCVHRAELEALRQSEARYRLLFEHSGDAIMVMDARGRLVDVNYRAQQLTGYVRAQLCTMALPDLIPPSERTESIGRLRNLRQRSELRGEYDILRRDGTVVPVEYTATRVAPGRYLTILRDISERREAEEAHAQLVALVNSSEDAIIGETLDGIITSWNPAAERLYGYTAEQALGRSASMFFPPERSAELQDQLAAIRRGERVERIESERLTRDGRRIIVSVTLSPVHDPEGQIIGLSAISHDITERKLTEWALRQSEDELRAIFNNVYDAILLHEPDGRIIDVNDKMLELFGVTREEARRMSIADDLSAPTNPVAELPSLWQRVVAGESLFFEWCARRPPDETTFDVEVYLRRLNLLDHYVIMANVRDISERKRGEAERDQLTQEIERRSEQLEDFVRAVSHDLRTPLAVIKGHVQLLDEALDAGGAGHPPEHIDAILRSLRRMDTMLQDLVDAARLEGGRMVLRRKPVALPTYLAGLLDRLSAALEIGRVVTDLPQDLPPVCADPDRLERILVNLISNALKYAPSDTPVLVCARPDGEMIRIAVRDYGSGIPPQDIPHLFDRFYRGAGERKAEGLGLGLYITRMLVEAHGGEIRVESTPGQGSTFIVRLPAA